MKLFGNKPGNTETVENVTAFPTTEPETHSGIAQAPSESNKNVEDEESVNEEGKAPEEAEEEVVKPYTFRRFSSPDVFIMFKLISKIGFKDFKKAFESDDVKETIKKAKEDGKEGMELVEAVQIDVALGVGETILANIDRCESEVYKMLSAISDLSEEEVKDLSGADFAGMVIDFIQKDDFGDFIKVVLRLFK